MINFGPCLNKTTRITNKKNTYNVQEDTHFFTLVFTEVKAKVLPESFAAVNVVK